MRKPRVLWVGEATHLHTGYAVYGKEVLNRLWKTGKYEIAEQACYGDVGEPRRFDNPWGYYGNLPTNGPETEEYRNSPPHAFGRWRFERIALDFKPDVVIDIRDFWMVEHEGTSPYRRLYNWALMPTVDSEPQQEQWLSAYIDADAIFTYSKYGKDVLQSESNNKVKFIDTAPPGAAFNIFKPVQNKKDHKGAYGFVDDINIVGTVMRNQARKLYPDLLEAFKTFIEKYPAMGEKTFLYLHTAYPDSGWDIPYFLKRNNLGNKVLFTYVCPHCQYVFPSFFQDARTICRRCNNPSAILPNTSRGVDESQLAQILNCFDVYVQYSVCEGFGMPQVEAAACGVPVMAVNYSAMESILKDIDGIPIDVERYFWDAGTSCRRALPSNNDFIEKLHNFLRKPKEMQQKQGRNAMIGAIKHYNYDKTAAVWEKYLDSVPIYDGIWDSPPRIIHPNTNVPPGLTNDQFVRWVIINTLGEPEKLNSYMALRMLRDLNYGEAFNGGREISHNEASLLAMGVKMDPFSYSHVVERALDMANKRNYFEQLRVGMIKESTPDFIKYAKKAE